MRHLYITLLTVLMGGIAAQAQNAWVMAMFDGETNEATITEYHGQPEVGANGVDYLRIYDWNFLHRHEPYNPLKTRYGYKLADKKILVYDYETEQERVAMDFTLAAGSEFTTLNGLRWQVETVKDTMVNLSFCGTGESISKKLLTVKSVDGTWSDQWLEDFGSLTNHFMIADMDHAKPTQVLWMEYDMGEYLAREVNADPIFGHDSGWMDGTYDSGSGNEFAKCTYVDGNVVFQNVQWWWEHREYTCFYRVGDDIFCAYVCELNPHVDDGTCLLREDIITFQGLPEPQSGSYTMHINGKDYHSRITDITSPTATTVEAIYDLQGRKLKSAPTQPGVYIHGGKKVIIK